MVAEIFGKLGTNGERIVRLARRIVISIVGASVLLVGVAMIVLPGPAVIVIPLGLGILAAEFTWAKNLLERLKREGKRAVPERWQKLLGLGGAEKKPGDSSNDANGVGGAPAGR